ncbi:hypothetical protein DICPUDRAFT_151795 [Dictyostelium purpureum]|uniref:F-box domain-containing protein n=1 Tax=Dictyostelium purpureum TaxID=5786 RepID=F0ZJR6_DICPU|nr:uncharacterized protein DICPUDRAFT_151795 [Dictyostelium purpureum]EGC35814.1 hypothetical protein DICPUDRAFT_151795 [Dictyostelium purpureum]|eukprot:XP_003287651.1 hypothetical protein DICPUDRAFT_151795 [Dictyostelium purpureum]
MEQPILSKYLQKYIVDIIISNINKEKKQLSKIVLRIFLKNEPLSDIVQLQNDFKGLEKVCWYWFELVRNGSNIISYAQLNNNGNEDSKYSIIKKENIKYLYISRDFFYEDMDEDYNGNGNDNEEQEDEDEEIEEDEDEEEMEDEDEDYEEMEEDEEEMEHYNDNHEEGNADPMIKPVILRIKHSISKYPNLKRIIINLSRDHIYQVLNGLKKGDFDNKGSQTISKAITETETKTQPPSPRKIKISTPSLDYTKIVLSNSNLIVDKVLSLNVVPDSPEEVQSVNLIPFLQNLKQAKSLSFSGNLFQLLLKQIYNNPTTNKQKELSTTTTATTNATTTSNSNSNYNSIIKCLSNVENYIFLDSPITIEQLYYLFLLSPKIKLLLIEICYDNLIYQLETNSDEPLVTPPTPCKYCSSNYNQFLQASAEFRIQWEFIYNTIRYSKKLTSLNLVHKCPSNSNLEEATFGSPIGEYQTLELLPKYTIETLGSMIRNNKSIEMLKIDSFHTSQLLEYIYNDSDDTSNSNNNKNTTITQICSSFRILNPLIETVRSSFLKIANEIVSKNDQIQDIILNELDGNYEFYKNIFSFDFTKNSIKKK